MKALIVPVCVAFAFAACGDDENGAAARPAAAAQAVEIPLEPAHRSGVTGRATLVADGAALKVSLTIDGGSTDTHMAHIHTGPCSDEPTFSNPRIWANLTDVIDGRSETTVDVVTLAELQAEGASINVHDPAHGQRALMCGDIPKEGSDAS
jgi:hypothetical protein